MSTHNIGFYEDWKKIIFELSSNMHLISSAALKTLYSMHPLSAHIIHKIDKPSPEDVYRL